MEHTSPWWGKYSVPLDATSYWRVGPLEVWIQRSLKEWRIGTKPHEDPTDPSLVVNRTETKDTIPVEGVHWYRFAFRSTAEIIELTTALAPRPLVVRPEIPILLPPKESATLHVSFPLWIQFNFGQSATKMFETPVFRPSDTWFGSSTIEGELCYAGRTRARLRLEDLDYMPHRAYSACHIRNRAKSELSLDRLKLPMPNLSVFSAKDGRLWTETVTLDRREDGDIAELQLEKAPPREVHPARLLRGPRSKPEKGLLIRAFGGLFG